MTLSGYSSNDARYRIYNGGNQYNCWDESTNAYVAATGYGAGPKVVGSPTSTTTFWILFQIGTNTTSAGSYRDRLGTGYSSNYQTTTLPSATGFTTSSYNLTGTIAGCAANPLTKKYVVLGFDATSGGNLIVASSTALTSGTFSLSAPNSITIRRVEIRSISNDILSTTTGTWSSSTNIGASISICSYTVTYNSNGGSGTMSNQTASTATNLTSNTFTRSGYTFSGWNTASNGSGIAYANGVSYNFAADLTLYAQWSANINTITFDANGGTGTMASQSLATDATANLNTNSFTRTGYTFAGWATTAGGAVAYTNAASYTMGTSNVTLYAKWTVNNYTITFDGNGSTGGSMSNQAIVAFASANLTANAFTRTGYTFSGWNTASDGSGTSYANSASYTMGTVNVTLYAQWTVYVGPCLDDNFNSGYGNWTLGSGTYQNATAGLSSNGTGFNSTGDDIITTVSISNPSSISFQGAASGSTSSFTIKVQYATSSSGPWTDEVTLTANGSNTGTITSTWNLFNFPLVSGAHFLRIIMSARSIGSFYLDDVQIFCAPLSPALEVSTTTLTGLDYTVGFGPSAVQTLTLTGSNLDGSDVELITGNNDFEISADNSTFSDYINLGAYNGASQTIYVRLKSGLPVNSYTDVILIAGGGVDIADEPEVNISGNVVPVVAPVITSSVTQTVSYGSTVSYQITASNTPTSFSAANLPAGLSVNAATGIISGTVTENVGTVLTTITATNSAGSDNKTLTWTITPKTLTISGLTGTDKVYDGTTAASVSGTVVLNGIVGSDNVTVSGTGTGLFDDKNVGTGKTITVSGYTLSGTKAGNYTLTQPAATANITVKTLTVTGATAQNKVYDGTATATITGGTLVGVISPDAVTFSGGGTFASPNAGTGISVTPSLTLSGTQAGNYTLTQPTGLSATITKANPVFTTSTINITVGGTYSLPGANISSTSDGTLSYIITNGGNATLFGTTITGEGAGTETLTVSQAASTNYNSGNTTVTVNVASFNTGDYRTTSSGNWHSTAASNTATWEQFNGTTWVTSSAPGINVASLGTKTVYIRDSIYLVGNNTAPYVVIANGGILNTSTVTATFGNLLVKSGGKFYRKANGSGVSGTFEVEDNGTVYFYHTNTTSRSSSIWSGTEKFHSNSNFYIRESQNSGGFLIIESNNDVSEYNGACFGNLYIDLVDGGKMSLIPANFTKTLANNLIFRTGTENFTISSGGTTLNVLNNLIMESTFNYNMTYLTASGTTNSTIGGKLINNSSKVFRLVNNASGNVTVNVAGNVEINSGSIEVNFNGTGLLNIQGNLTVASGASLTANSATTATVRFSGGNVQNVSGAGTINIYHGEISKSGGIVNLQRNLQVRNTLKMISGNLQTNAYLFELGESTSQTGTLTYTSGYVLGNMKRWFSGTSAGTDTKDLFPLGYDESGIKNRFAKIRFTGGAPSGALTAHFVGSPMGANVLPIVVGSANSAPDITFDITSTENQGYWDISASSGTFSSAETYTATLVGEGFTTITDVSRLVLLKRPDAATAWFVPGTSGTGTTINTFPAVVRNGISTFSHFGFGGADENPLPIQLLSFNVSCENNQHVAISWSTATETNNEKFIVEKSRNASDWSVLEEVKGQGNSNKVVNYELTDRKLASGTTYYRLAQVDFDGKQTTYNSVSTTCEGTETIVVYPNPASALLNVAINSNNLNGNITVSLIGTDGKIIEQRQFMADSENTLITFNVAPLQAGMYFIQLQDSEGTFKAEKVQVK